MHTSLEITFRGMSPSPAVETAVAHWLERLTRTFDRIERCHVWIALPHRHHRRGAQFQVRVVLLVPGAEIAVSREPGRDEGHADVYLAIADAFLAARRRLQDHASIRRGDIKAHAA